MKKTRSVKKLVLASEAIAHLTSAQLQHAAGGQLLATGCQILATLQLSACVTCSSDSVATSKC